MMGNGAKNDALLHRPSLVLTDEIRTRWFEKVKVIDSSSVREEHKLDVQFCESLNPNIWSIYNGPPQFIGY